VALDNAEKFGKMPQYFMVTYQREGLCGCGPLDIVEVLGIFESFGDAKRSFRQSSLHKYAKDIYETCHIGEEAVLKDNVAALIKASLGAENMFDWSRYGDHNYSWNERWIEGVGGMARQTTEPGCCFENNDWTIKSVEIPSSVRNGPLSVFSVCKSNVGLEIEGQEGFCYRPGGVVGHFLDWREAKKALREAMRQDLMWLFEGCSLRRDSCQSLFEEDLARLMNAEEGAEAQFDWEKLSDDRGDYGESWEEGASASVEGMSHGAQCSSKFGLTIRRIDVVPTETSPSRTLSSAET